MFGETLKPDILYKTLFMNNQDTVAFAVKETLHKYDLSGEDPDNYCLVQVNAIMMRLAHTHTRPEITYLSEQ